MPPEDHSLQQCAVSISGARPARYTVPASLGVWQGARTDCAALTAHAPCRDATRRHSKIRNGCAALARVIVAPLPRNVMGLMRSGRPFDPFAPVLSAARQAVGAAPGQLD